jgi:Domain of unknown function (DUF6457)
MTADQWLAEYASALGAPPPPEAEVETILALAGVAAHTSERTAAPVACWIAAASGRSAAEALALARQVGGTSRGAERP